MQGPVPRWNRLVAQGPGIELLSLHAHTAVLECDGNDRTTHALVHQLSWPRPPQSLHSGPPFSNSIPHCDRAPLRSCFSSFSLFPALPWKEAPPRLCPGILKLDSRRERDTARQKAVRHRSDLPISPALSVISTASPGANPSTYSQPASPSIPSIAVLVPWSLWIPCPSLTISTPGRPMIHQPVLPLSKYNLTRQRSSIFRYQISYM